MGSLFSKKKPVMCLSHTTNIYNLRRNILLEDLKNKRINVNATVIRGYLVYN